MSETQLLTEIPQYSLFDRKFDFPDFHSHFAFLLRSVAFLPAQLPVEAFSIFTLLC